MKRIYHFFFFFLNLDGHGIIITYGMIPINDCIRGIIAFNMIHAKIIVKGVKTRTEMNFKDNGTDGTIRKLKKNMNSLPT